MTVTFTFDAGGLKKAAEIVVFESLYREDVEIAVHADIDDDGQTVTITPPGPPVPEIPQTGDNSSLGFWIGLGAVALGGWSPAELSISNTKRTTMTNDEEGVYLFSAWRECQRESGTGSEIHQIRADVRHGSGRAAFLCAVSQ